MIILIIGISILLIPLNFVLNPLYTQIIFTLLLAISAFVLSSNLLNKQTPSKERFKQSKKKSLMKIAALKRDIESLKEQVAFFEQENKILQEENERVIEERNKFEHDALHDPLTKLPNRTFLVEKLEFLLTLCKRIPSMRFYVLFIDLVRFKNINDYLGHTIGDRLLSLIARRIKRVVGVEDMVTRLGGDEFAVVISDPLSIEKVQQLALNIHKSITSSPFLIRKNKIDVKLHIGLAAYDPLHETPEDILRDADIAMHYAKEHGLPVAFFDDTLKNQFLENAEIERGLTIALKEKQFLLHYQPIISLANGDLIGFEALLRWKHPTKGFISPAKFIPVAEDSGLIIPMTDWILTEACLQIAKWQKIRDNLTISINLSGKHFAMESLPSEVANIINKTGAKPESVRLEVTETSAMENPNQSLKSLNELKKLGVKLSIDDFGSGYSSLSQLYRLPFDAIKIDRSFVSAIDEAEEAPEILKAIILLGQSLGMKLTAEGIETVKQLKCLQKLGCDYAQGYLIAKPMPKEQAEELVTTSWKLEDLIETRAENLIETA
jgi:diguanylate cyclase (GGDEF)-like protein